MKELVEKILRTWATPEFQKGMVDQGFTGAVGGLLLRGGGGFSSGGFGGFGGGMGGGGGASGGW